MNNQNRPRQRTTLTPAQERQRAEWAAYAAEEQARRQAAMAARKRAEAERARRAEAERRAERARAWGLFCGRFVIYLVMLALILVVSFALFVVSLHKTDPVEHPASISYTVGGEWDAKGKEVEQPVASLTLDYADAVREGVPYLPMTAIADLCGLRITGTHEVMKFTTASGEYVRLTANSNRAEVNGDICAMDGAFYVSVKSSDDETWVPLSFVSAWMQGVTVEHDEAAGKIAVALDEDVPLGFKLKGHAALAAIDEAEEFGDTPAIAFKADLSAYEEYMNPADRDAYITLINVAHPLSESHIPADLTNVADTRKDGRNTQQLRLYAAKALEAFFIEMRACGITDVSVTSGYRSYAYQKQLFEQRVAMYPSLSRAEAEAKAATVVAIPGSSEHQSGLCIDMHNLASADIQFGTTTSFAWLSQNAHKFGFILRFPEDKVAQTGISYEPWHYRYVGRYHATRIYESGLCLEEYCAKYGLGT